MAEDQKQSPTKADSHEAGRDERKDVHPEPADGVSEGAVHSQDEEQSPPTEPEVLKAKVAELEDLSVQLRDQLLRKAAEFENYKKRVEKEYGDRIKFAHEDILTKLLPVIDDFERSLKMGGSGKHGEGDKVFYRGVELIFQKLMKILKAVGMKHYEVVGKPFDTYFHDALMQIPKENVPPHTVIEEVEKGYMLHDKVLRHAKVIVAGETDHRPAGEEQHGDETGEQDAAQERQQGE